MADSIDERLAKVKEWRAPAFGDLLDALLAKRSPIYVVGGPVRDFLLGRDEAQNDLDLAVEKPVQDLARQVADEVGWAYYALDRDRDVARLVSVADADEGADERLEVDLAGLRGDLENDLRSRDFTINSLAIELTPGQPPRLVDVCNGVEHLRQRRLEIAQEVNLDDDPLRMMRAVRLAAKLDFTVPADLRARIRKRALSVQGASNERMRDELWKMFTLPQPSALVRDLQDLDLLPYVLPELAATVGWEQSPPHHLDVYEHTLQVMDDAARLRDWLLGEEVDLDPQLGEMLSPWADALRPHFAEEIANGHTRAHWLVWHALFHDVGKRATRSEEATEEGTRYRFFDHESVGAEMTVDRLTALRFSRREIRLAQTVVAAHMRPLHLHNSFEHKAISRRAAYRFFRDTADGANGERTGLDVLLLALADRQATGDPQGEEWSAYLQHISQLFSFGLRDLPGTSEPLLDGDKLIATFNLEEGPLIGHVLEQIREAQAAGEVTSAADAMVLAAQLLDRTLTDLPDETPE